MDGLGEHAVAVVEEEDEKEDDERQEAKLDARPNLQ